RQEDALALQPAQSERREPGAVRRLAELRAQHVSDLGPLAVEIWRGALRLKTHRHLWTRHELRKLPCLEDTARTSGRRNRHSLNTVCPSRSQQRPAAVDVWKRDAKARQM